MRPTLIQLVTTPLNYTPRTTISFSAVEIYANCHVYMGRVRGGDLANVHLLLVLPNGNSSLPTVPELQEQDKEYLTPIGGSTSRASTLPRLKPSNIRQQ